MTDQTYRQIKFADELVTPLLDGEKEATIRYDGFESVQVGDVLRAVTQAGTPFADVEVTRTASVLAVEAHGVLRVFDANYPSSCPEDVIEQLNRYYDTSIGPATTVQVLVLDVKEHLVTAP